MSRRLVCLLICSLLVVFVCAPLFAEGPDEGEDNGRLRALMEEVPVPVEISMKTEIDKLAPKPVLPSEKVMIKEVRVLDVTLIPSKEIEEIIQPFSNTQISGKDMQRCADQITDTYNLKGFITSYAYVVPERLSEGILEIRGVEGKIGKIKIQGNKYYATRIYQKKLSLKEGDVVDYAFLRNNVYRINKHQDRKATLELTPGEEPGLTDITLSVKDKSPLHFTNQDDNYGSTYIMWRRYKGLFLTNNFTGHDDSLQAKVQWTEADAHKLYDLDYFIPITNNLTFELYLMPYKKENYMFERKVQGMEKRARKWYFYFFQKMVDTPTNQFTLNYGFVYKNILWYAYGDRQKEDKFRAGMLGFDWMIKDKWGTTAISDDIEMGIPGIWGGADIKPYYTSVPYASGRYKKNHLQVARRQKLIGDVELIFKSHWQMSSTQLTGVNAFSVGGYCGVIDNRGYPRAQHYGASGYSFHPGLAFPPYFLPKGMNVPFYNNVKWHNALKIFTFYDWANAYQKTYATKDGRSSVWKSAGFGLTLNLPNNLAVRIDNAWPVGSKGKAPADGDHCQTWWSFTKGF
ncbi:MAG: POTRA domain-containing protein [Candidatus Omnitrophota bacterium]